MQNTIFEVGTIVTTENEHISGIVISERFAMFFEYKQKKCLVSKRRIPKDATPLADFSRLTRDAKVAFIAVCAILNISDKHIL